MASSGDGGSNSTSFKINNVSMLMNTLIDVKKGDAIYASTSGRAAYWTNMNYSVSVCFIEC